jgi:hypothetical protein
MKKSIFSTLIVLIFGTSAFLLMSNRNKAELKTYSPTPPRSNGAANMGLGDRTGGPLSGGASCMDCHGAGTFQPNIALTVLDAGSNQVTEYTPGDTYTIQYNVTSTGSPAGFGMQSVALNLSNGAAGTLNTPGTPNTQIVPIAGLQYLEHSGISTTGVFEVNWVAPAQGMGTVNFFARGIAVNGNGVTAGDIATAPFSLALTEAGFNDIAYSSSTYCSDQSNPSPVQSGEQGGVYSSSAGLSINSANGEIDLLTSTPGTYTVTYTFSNGSVTNDITINQAYDETSSATICSTETFPFGGQQLDIFDEGLNIFTYQTVDGCDSTVSLTLTVNEVDNNMTLSPGTGTSDQAGGIYNWLDCNTNDTILQEHSQVFTPSIGGNYAVIVTFNGCTDTSACEFIALVGLDEINSTSLTLSPVPTSDFLSIDGLEKIGEVESIKIIGIDGKLNNEIRINNGQIDVTKLNNGVYFILVEHSNGVEKMKFVKN